MRLNISVNPIPIELSEEETFGKTSTELLHHELRYKPRLSDSQI